MNGQYSLYRTMARKAVTMVTVSAKWEIKLKIAENVKNWKLKLS